jgi:predicted transglutaminase-like cysteine proteinase
MLPLYKIAVLLLSLAGTSFNIDENWILRSSQPAKSVTSIAFGSRAVAPFGSVVFCQNFPESCQRQGARGIPVDDGRIVLSDDLFNRIMRVNREINRRMTPKIDATWHIGGSSGDCKDYALTKRDILDKIGLPTSATLIATVLVPGGQMHAVLVLRTDRGDFVLDNLSSAIRSWTALPYHWNEIQSPDDPSIWLRVSEPAVS